MNIRCYNVKNELPATLETEDKWILHTLNNVAKEINENLEKFELGIALSKIYDFIGTATVTGILNFVRLDFKVKVKLLRMLVRY